MNDVCSFSFGVLAHGFDISRGSGISLLIIMSLFVFGLLIFRKDARIPKGLFVSSIIPYVLVLICILQLSFELQVPDATTGYICFAAVFYLNLPMIFIFGTGSGFFFAAFIIDTLIIFGIIRLILYIKQKITVKKPQAV